MAETAYTGLQGHGKTYEVVLGVIVPNVAKGRRVVTNIAGLQIEKIHAYCLEHFDCDPQGLGDIVQVTNERIAQPKFFPVENADNSDCVVQGGDVVVLDEVWRWYVAGEQAPDGHLTFFRMHRHFLHPETGQACDVVLIVQSIGDLQRKFRATVEKSFLMLKHKALGLENRYHVTIFSGNRQVKASFIQEFDRRYDSAVFELYSSYSQSQSVSGPKEDQADSRGNLFAGRLFRFGIPLAVLFMCGSAWFGWRFFHPDQPKVELAQQAKSVDRPSDQIRLDVAESWRLIGSIVARDSVVFMLENGQGRVRYLENAPGFKLSRFEQEVALPTGEVAARWTGAMSASPSIMQGMKK